MPQVQTFTESVLSLHECSVFQVPVRPGLTLKEALNKAMKLRELDPDDYHVYRIKPKYVITFYVKVTLQKRQ